MYHPDIFGVTHERRLESGVINYFSQYILNVNPVRR